MTADRKRALATRRKDRKTRDCCPDATHPLRDNLIVKLNTTRPDSMRKNTTGIVRLKKPTNRSEPEKIPNHAAVVVWSSLYLPVSGEISNFNAKGNEFHGMTKDGSPFCLLNVRLRLLAIWEHKAARAQSKCHCPPTITVNTDNSLHKLNSSHTLNSGQHMRTEKSI